MGMLESVLLGAYLKQAETMKQANPYDQYLNVNFTTASPARLVVMTYDAAIRSLKEARRGIRENDYQRRVRNFDLSVALIGELRKSLNKERGGEIADKLDALYQYFTRELLMANVTNDADRIEPIINIMVELRASWEKARQDLANA